MAATTSLSSMVGRVALITGASSGIGRSTAKLFASHGASVAVTGRNLKALEELVAEIKESGGNAACFTADIQDDEAVKSVVSSTVEHFGGLNILVNNAGVLQGGAADTATMANWDFNMNTNARAAFCFMQNSLPHLKAAPASTASIVNVSSVNGQQSFGGCLSYCASKAAMDMMTQCASLDLAVHGIRVNSVNPGVTMTNLQKTGGMTEDAYTAFVDRAVNTTHPLAASRGSVASPEEVAQAIHFLASDSASFITGVILPVDGGRLTLGAR